MSLGRFPVRSTEWRTDPVQVCSPADTACPAGLHTYTAFVRTTHHLTSPLTLCFFSPTEKHKTYHIKDEQLTRDGFKKFMKQDPCPFEGCRFSGNCNHIHCIRSGCSYVLHSSGQLFSHKRKHERKDSELAYRKYKLAQSMMKSLVDGQAFADQFGAVEDVGALQSLMAGLGGQPAAPQPPPPLGAVDPADGGRRSLSPGQGQGLSQGHGQGGPNHAAPPPHPLLALQQHMPAFRLGLDMMPPPYMLEGASSAPSDAPTDLTRSSPTLADMPTSWHTPQPAPSAPQPPSQSPQQAQSQNLPVSKAPPPDPRGVPRCGLANAVLTLLFSRRTRRCGSACRGGSRRAPRSAAARRRAWST